MAFDFRRFLRFWYSWLFRSPWTRRRVCIAAASVIVVPVVVVFNWTFLLLDRLLFPGFSRRAVEAPVFIAGNPRSGTTLMHRLLAKDRERFSTMCMWEILFAPSVTQRKLAHALAALDRALGSPLGRRLGGVEEGWHQSNVMHEVSLLEPEEDDYLFLHVWSALTIGLSSGLLDEARPYVHFDQALPAHERTRLMKFYRRCLQRHLYAHGRDGAPVHYLAKNPALCPKLGSVLAEFPDAKIIYIARNPLQALPSYLSMMQFSWQVVGVPVDGEGLREFLLEMAAHWYRYPLERLARLASAQYFVVNYDDLVRDTRGTIEKIYSHFGFEVDPAFAAVLDVRSEQTRHYKSQHAYAGESLGLPRERIVTEFSDIFERFGFDTGP